MSLAKTTSVCPFCKEVIADGATKCKHCQSDLSELKRKKKSYFSRYNTFKFGFYTGALGVLLLGLAVYVYFRFFFHR
jgi:hypothetical protein